MLSNIVKYLHLNYIKQVNSKNKNAYLINEKFKNEAAKSLFFKLELKLFSY